MKYKNGDRYVGKWVQDERVGHGEMWYVTGDHYVGNWEHDMRHGTGTIIYSNGSRFNGEWAYDIRVGGRGNMTIVQEMEFNFQAEPIKKAQRDNVAVGMEQSDQAQLIKPLV